MHASREELTIAAQGHPAPHPQAGRAPGPQAPPRAQGAARLPQHDAPLAVLRRRAGRAQVPLSPAGQARDHGGGRHLRVGGRLRPVHAAAGVRHQQPVQQGPQLRVHRRHRRGHVATSRASRTSPRRSTGSTRRPTSSGSTATRDYGHAFETFWETIGQGDHLQDNGDPARRRPQQLPRLQRLGRPARSARRPATCTGSTPSPASYWDTGDSIVSQYGVHCDGVYECRNLRQLERFVDVLD